MSIALVGNILMGAGVVVFILGLIFTFRKRQVKSTRRTVVGGDEGGNVVRRTDRIDNAGL